MLTTFREKSQITLPKSIVTLSKLQKGDIIDVEFKDGKIIITPVLVIDKNLLPDGINAEFLATLSLAIDKYDETLKGLKDRQYYQAMGMEMGFNVTKTYKECNKSN